jgi:hypothetical protein
MGKALRFAALGMASTAGYLLMAAPAEAATIYYSNNFSGTASGGFSNSYADLTTYSTGATTVAPNTFPSSDLGTYTIVEPGPTLSNGAYSSVQLSTPTGANTSFTESVNLDISSAGGSGAPTAGIRYGTNLIGVATTGTTSVDANSYWTDINSNKTTPSSTVLRLFQNNGTASTAIATSMAFSSFAYDTNYLLTLSGTYNSSGALTLTGTVALATTPGTPIVSIATPSPITPFAGLSVFGMRQAAGTSGSNTTTYDNLLVTATPEPATLGFLGVAGAILGLRRRRPKAV